MESEANLPSGDYYLDPHLLDLMLSNLLSNAAKYTPEGRTIRLKATMDEATGQWQIMVADEGRGMNEEDMRHAGSRFFRGQNTQDTSGSGIGLYLVHRMAALCGARVSLHSVLHEGTRVTLYFPLQPYEESRAS